jgi:hypothetical protein
LIELIKSALEIIKSMEDTRMKTWLTLGGAALVVYAATRFISASTYENIPTDGDTLVSAISVGLGIVLLAVSYFIKEEKKA